MKKKLLIGLASTVLFGVVSLNAAQIVRETWDDMNLLGSLYPANQSVTNSTSSVGFVTSSPWITNPAEHANNTLLSIRDFFPEPWSYGLPPNYDGTTVALCQDNSFPGSGGSGTLWTAGIWMVRPLVPASWINFNANGEYWLSMHVGMVFDAQYAGDIPATGAGGIGFTDGATTNANFVAIGVSGTNVFLGPPDGGHPFGTVEATKSAYISQGTLGQPSNPYSLIYNPQNDPGTFPGGTNYQGGLALLTNFTGGPYYINAFTTNRVGQCQGDAIMVLGHLVTHAGGNATMQVTFYNPASADVMELNPNTISWGGQYSFNYTGTMSNFLVFENGEFPLYIYDLRVGTTYANVVGLDSEATVYPRPNVYSGSPINFTNYVGLATPDSNPALGSTANYGTLTYQWQQNGANINGATTNYLNIASASTTDPAMPAGTDAGTFTCITTDASGTWGSVTSAPVVITVTVDNIAPFITSIVPSADLSTVIVTFSEPVTGADVLGNYNLTGGATVTNVTAATINNQTVATLQTTAQPLSTKLTLTLSGVKDLAGNPLTPSTVTFWSDMYSTGFVDYDAWTSAVGYSTPSYFAAYPTAATPTPAPGFSASYSSWEAPLANVVPPGGGATQNSSYGGKMYGWFIPPVTTNYAFFLCADDAARLSLSTNEDPANLCVIAVEDLWSPTDNWTNYSTAYPTGDHRGSGAAGHDPGGFGGPTGGWDAGPDQNRSDELIAAYKAETNGLWTATEIAFITDVVGNPSAMPFWPALDSNGNALITLQAGHKYYMQVDHQQGYGGANLSVTYKFGANPGNRTDDPATGTASIITGAATAAIVAFRPNVSISQGVSGLVINYTGTLQSATTVQGPYSDVSGASNPYTPTGPGPKFYRSRE